jgi:hypothetical protein
MSRGPFDPRAIPVLTDAVEGTAGQSRPVDLAAIRSELLAATLDLADTLLHDAAGDLESLLFERVLDRLHAQLPELVDRVLRGHLAPPDEHPAPPEDPANQDETPNGT